MLSGLLDGLSAKRWRIARKFIAYMVDEIARLDREKAQVMFGNYTKEQHREIAIKQRIDKKNRPRKLERFGAFGVGKPVPLMGKSMEKLEQFTLVSIAAADLGIQIGPLFFSRVLGENGQQLIRVAQPPTGLTGAYVMDLTALQEVKRWIEAQERLLVDYPIVSEDLSQAGPDAGTGSPVGDERYLRTPHGYVKQTPTRRIESKKLK